MQMKLLLLSAFALVAISGLPAAAAVPTQFANLGSHSPSGPVPMPGMDHGSTDMPGMDHGSTDMPGMDHGSTDMPGMDHGNGTTGTSSQERPIKPVLGVFGIATSAVLLGAGFLRRQDRAQHKIKQANLAARRNQK